MLPMNQTRQPNLIVYTTRWCPDCRIAKRFLDQHDVDYIEIDIDQDPDAACEVERQTGKRAIPQFVIDGQWVQPYSRARGFHYEEMKRMLGLERERAALIE